LESKRHTVILEPISKRVNILEGQTVYEALLSLNYPIGALCGGKGTCGKCLIQIIDKDAKISPPSKLEILKIGNEKISQGFRLACQTKIEGDSRVYLTESLLSNNSKILIDSDIKGLGIEPNRDLDPIIRAEFFKVQEATLENPISDLSRFENSLKEMEKNSRLSNQYKVSSSNNIHCEQDTKPHERSIINDQLFQLLTTFPSKIRNQAGKITAFFRRNMQMGPNTNVWELFDVEDGDYRDKIYGLAVDIGTTTIVAYLINLTNGELISIAAMLNPQTAIGEDLISRITYIKKNNARGKAQELLTGAINSLLNDTCIKGSIKIADVKDIVVVGNTGIHHMFFGLPSEYLALSPFTPVVKAPMYVRANTLGLSCNSNVNVYSPPVIAGFVGTDTIGCIIASRIDLYDKYTLLIDIGTNGELVLGNKQNLVTGSCAAGSALEGAQISHGMRAAEGSIECVTIEENTLNPKLKTIGNIEPIGICGSGLIDIVAEMLRNKIINRSGKINTKSDLIKSNRRIIQTDGEYKFIVYNQEWDNESNSFEPIKHNDEKTKASKNIKDIKPDIITISQEDIRQIQLAKGAFLSGANILLNYEKKDQLALEQVVLAGAFGTYINKENARFIGLFPEINHQKIFQIGNAAGMGAQLCLKSAKMRYLADDLAYRVKYHEIASSPIFQHEYAYSLYFPYFDLNKFPDLKEFYKDIPTK
jgi:uncharacterized 2Fe-2S/4Fe-4S cluster protein (DUF4445 family)